MISTQTLKDKEIQSHNSIPIMIFCSQSLIQKDTLFELKEFKNSQILDSQKLIEYSTINRVISEFNISFQDKGNQKKFFHFELKKQIINSTLRGGGCGQSRPSIQNKDKQIISETNKKNKVQLDFLPSLESNLTNIIEKAHLGSENEEILLSFQWFIAMKEQFNILCLDGKEALRSIDLILQKFPLILQSTITYLRSSGVFCLQVLQICNELAKVLFSFFITNNQRFLKVEEKQGLLDLVTDFETQLKIESSNIWVAGAEFEIEMIKAVISSSPSNSDEGSKLMKNFAGGIVGSLLTMSITDELLDALIEGANFLRKAYQVNNMKVKYEIYYYFEQLKWQILNSLIYGISVKKIIRLLSEAYQKHIHESTDWLLNFCWVRMISFLIQYKPLIFKQKNVEDWEVLIQAQQISLMSFDKNYGILKQSQHQVPYTVNQILVKLGMKQLDEFQNILLHLLKSTNRKPFTLNQGTQNINNREDYFYQLLQEEVNQDLEQNNFEEIENQIKIFREDLLNVKSEKSMNLYNRKVKDQINQLISNVFAIYDQIDRTQIIIYVTIQKYRLIIESINLQSLNEMKQKLLLEIVKLEDELQKNQVQSQLQDEKCAIVANLINLQYKIKSLIIQGKQDEIKSMVDELKFIVDFISHHKQYNTTLKDTLKNLQKQIKLHSQNYKKGTNVNFSHPTPINCITIITLQLTNSNNLQNYVKMIEKVISTVEINTSVQQYCLVSYLLNDIIGLMLIQKVRLETIQSFLKNNLSQFQGVKAKIDSNCNQQVNQGLPQLLIKIKNFLTQESQKIRADDQNTQLHQLICELQIHQQNINESDAKQNNSKEILFSLQVIEQLLRQYEKTPEKLVIIKEQIELIQAKLNQYQSTEIEQEIQQEPQQMKLSQITLQINESQFEKELCTQLDTLNQSIDRCKSIISVISENFSFQKKIWKLSQASNTVDLNTYSKIFENDAMKRIHFDLKFLMDQPFCLNNLQPHKQEQPRSCDLLLVFLDVINKTAVIERQTNTGLKQKIQNISTQASDFFDNQNYKVRQCYVISLLSIQQTNESLNQFCQNNIVQLWATEKDERVKAFLKDKEIVNMQKKLFSSDLRSLSQRLQLEIQEKFIQLNDLEQKMNLEGDNQIRISLQKEIQQRNSDLEEYVDNISDMAAQLNLSLQFLKEIRKQLAIIKQKIEKLQDSINEIGDDVRKLRGKQFHELFEIRKRKVLESKQLRELNSIYIQLIVQEWDPITGNKIKLSNNAQESVLLADKFQDQTGEVNEFLLKELQQKDVMLLRGFAGSGKSRAAAKIEEYLWEKKDQKQSNWTPIYVSLPSLKEPKFNLIDQALESEYYQFDKIQVREFKDAMANKQLQVILILDSYDEMKLDCIQTNLYHTNRMALDLFGENSKSVKEHLKLIITTRTEILTQNSYQTWFYGESLQSLKEIELLGFDDKQQQEYLNEYTLLSVKKELFELYEFVKQVTKEKMDLNEFINFWTKIQLYLKSKENQIEDFIMTEQQASQILNIIKEEKCFKNISKDQIINLHKKLIALWSKQKFDKLIKNVNIQHILTSPFMMEIVVQVLPNMTKQYSDASVFKKHSSITLFKLRSKLSWKRE